MGAGFAAVHTELVWLGIELPYKVVQLPSRAPVLLTSLAVHQ